MNFLSFINNFIKNTSKTYFLATIGFVSLLSMFYIRFLRKRLPQDIPFILTELRFYVILFICVTLLYIIKVDIKPKIPNEYLQRVIQYIGLPFATFDNLLKTNKYSLSYIKDLINYSFPRLFSTQILIIMFLQLIPRIILVMIFLWDVFYFHKLYYFYYFLFLGIFSWLYTYHKYSMYHAKELGLLYLEALYDHVDMLERGWDEPTVKYEYDEYDILREIRIAPEWEPHPRNKYHNNVVSIREHFQILLEKDIDDVENDYDFEDNYYFDSRGLSKDYYYEQYEKITGKTNLEFADYDILNKEFKNIAPVLQNLCFHLHYLPTMEKKYYMDKINLIIVIFWLIAWTYILIKSIHTLENIEVTLRILARMTFHLINTNPFIDT